MGDPAVLASMVKVGQVTQREHSSPHIQKTAHHQKIHYYCLDVCTALPIMLVNHHNGASMIHAYYVLTSISTPNCIPCSFGSGPMYLITETAH